MTRFEITRFTGLKSSVVLFQTGVANTRSKFTTPTLTLST